MFSSKSFYQFYIKNKRLFSGTSSSNSGGFVYATPAETNVPTHDGSLRKISIPDPIAYAKQCELISRHWMGICSFFKRKISNQPFVVSKLGLSKRGNEICLFSMSSSPEDDSRVSLIPGCRYIAYSDIANFFPSIYTHSINWALSTKTKAKRTRRDHKSLGALLDSSAMDLRDRETDGLLIGPHASNLLAEIILSCVDFNLCKKGYRYTRYIDDYTCYANSKTEADSFLRDLSSELDEFKLSINFKKTKIEASPFAFYETWRREVVQMESALSSSDHSLEALESFFDEIKDLLAKYNNDMSIVKHAFKFLSSQSNLALFSTKIKKDLYVNMAVSYCLSFDYPITFFEECIVDRFVEYQGTKEIEGLLDPIINNAIKNLNYYGLSYSLYLLLKYQAVSKKTFPGLINCIDSSKDPILFLLGYLYYKEKGNKKYIRHFVSMAKRLSTSRNHSNYSKYWIFIYECLDSSDLQGNFKTLKNNGISFIDFQTEQPSESDYPKRDD